MVSALPAGGTDLCALRHPKPESPSVVGSAMTLGGGLVRMESLFQTRRVLVIWLISTAFHSGRIGGKPC